MTEKTKFGFLRRSLSLSYIFGSILGITLLMILFLELGAQTLIKLRQVYLNQLDYSKSDYPIQADVFEGVPWVADYFKNFDQCDKTQWHAYIYWRRQPCEGQYINVDQDGIRRTWNTPQTETAKKIFMFGGSTLWGSGAQDNYTIPSLISKMLAGKVDSDIQVYNYGESGYVFTQEIIMLLLQLRKGITPDLVVFYSGVNEVGTAFMNKEAGIPSNEINRIMEFNSRKRSEWTKVWEHSGINRIFRRLIVNSNRTSLIAFAKELPENLHENVAKVHHSNIDLVNKLSRAYGFNVLYYWQPMIYNKVRLSNFEQKQAQRYGYYKNFYLAAYKAITNHQALSNESNFHNISRIFEDESQPIYFDSVHITRKGNKKIAARMLEDVLVMLNDKSSK
jgi:lysophospholipase L1-like esterase